MTDAAQWLEDHVYVPILAGIVLLLLMGILIYCLCKKRSMRGSYYVYKRLEHEAELAEQMNREREEQQNVIRDSAYMNCQFYLRSHPNYKSMQQLKDLGSRIDKHWFLVCDFRTEKEQMLSCMPYNAKMTIAFTSSTCKTLKDLFSLLKHPHVFPMTDFDFSTSQNLIFTIQPVSHKGSLKDVIYQCRYLDSWYEKYSQKHKGLSVNSIQVYGKQVLSGMIYLEEKGFPPHGNIQAGNIIFEDGICRVAGYENKFLANTSRVYTLVKKKLKEENKNALDSLSFGHLLYEMAFGFELAAPHPEPQHLIGHQSPAIVEILNFIFENETGIYPTIREIADHPFFAKVDLPEMRKYNPVKIHLSEPMKMLLKAVKKGKPLKPPKPSSSTKRRKSKASSLGTKTSSSPTPSNNSSIPPPPPTGLPPPPPSGGPPPPPPPGGLPPPAPAALPSGSSSSGRKALLGDIQKGKKLKKTVTNDRSAPKV